jgi:hypothetical protein
MVLSRGLDYFRLEGKPQNLRKFANQRMRLNGGRGHKRRISNIRDGSWTTQKLLR